MPSGNHIQHEEMDSAQIGRAQWGLAPQIQKNWSEGTEVWALYATYSLSLYVCVVQ